MINRTEINGKAHKSLSDNRARYFAQSAATRNGVVPPPPPRFAGQGAKA